MVLLGVVRTITSKDISRTFDCLFFFCFFVKDIQSHPSFPWNHSSSPLVIPYMARRGRLSFQCGTLQAKNDYKCNTWSRKKLSPHLGSPTFFSFFIPNQTPIKTSFSPKISILPKIPSNKHTLSNMIHGELLVPHPQCGGVIL